MQERENRVSTIVDGDGGVVYSDDDILVTSKHVIVKKEWVQDPDSGVYPIEDIDTVNAIRDLSGLPGVVGCGLLFAGAVYFGWMLAALVCAVGGFLIWKFVRTGSLFLNFGVGEAGAADSVHIPSGYDRVIKQKEAIESQRQSIQVR